MSFTGVIIEESLADRSVLAQLRIVKTDVEPVTPAHGTPWLEQWTLHTVEVPDADADRVAERLSEALETRDSWYADFKNDTTHYIVYRGKVFAVDRASKEQYDEATAYGIAQGIPPYQVDFSPHVKTWERPDNQQQRG